jgi:putative oxidoreductase
MHTPTRPTGFARLLATPDDRVATLLRVVLGLVIIPHGLQKAFGLFGGYGWAGTMGYFTGQLHIPYALGALAIAAEVLGGLGLIVGLLGRVAAVGVASVMAVAALMQHRTNGFFMNWSGQQAGEGYEYHVLAFAIALAVVVRGSGAASLDRVLADRLARPRRADQLAHLTPARARAAAP